ncbi:carboxypeptidase-like regulatory domain-containing protein [Daejeonella sp.]|uniref:carboxypeptidase-like regulatory domain-containing protein n=1 Tax=Daejeonella sp. TaxID=2805397 RepID=UPI003983259A
MKTQIRSIIRGFLTASTLFLVIATYSGNSFATTFASIQTDTSTFIQYKGFVLDSKTKKGLAFATISVLRTNISGVSNSEGEFSIKISKENSNADLMISFLGYRNKVISLKELQPEKNQILLESFNVALGEVIVSTNDADKLFSQVLSKREQNYGGDLNVMTGFYRETIRKRRAYLSLSEAVVEIQKEPYLNNVDDLIELFKGRKNTDYAKLDTLAFKLQGGPYTTTFLDIMKYPSFIFTDDALKVYDFSLENNTQIDEKKVYVLTFKQKPEITTPLYYGKLFIDTESMAIISATFNLNVEDKKAAGLMFTEKKPPGAKVYPLEASYQINYREQDGKWLFAYSRGDITFKVNWDKKLLNTTYQSSIELAVTDWKKKNNDPQKSTQKLRKNVIMMDKVSNFADAEFWGQYNIIEPEKSIETAIRKIQRKI